MPALLIYLLKVNAALLLFCLGYYGVLRKLTFYTLNRVYLITAILFSTFYPVISIDGLLQRHEKLSAPLQPLQIVVIDISDRVVQIAQPAATNYWQWLVMLFWAGVVVMAFRLAAQFWSLFRIYKRSEPAKLYNQDVRVINEEANPFSFWQSIYINPKHHAEAELRSIIAHEQIHVKQWHTLDILLAEISLVFYWFNPGVWLMKKAVAENLEFITDRKILQQGIDAKSYQYSLLYASFNTSPNAMVNHFNISTIKKRIMMMNSKRSSKLNLTRYGFIAPIMIALLLVFGTSKAAFIRSTLKQAQKATTQAMANIGLTQVNTPQQPQTTTADNAVSDKRSAETITLHQAAVGTNLQITNIDTPKLKITPKLSSMGTDSVLYILDGEPLTSKADFQKVNMSEIESIDILKNTDAIKLFGDAGYKGAVVMVSKKGANYESIVQLVQKIKEIRLANGQNPSGSRVTGTVRLRTTKADTSLKPTGYYTPAGTTQKISLYGNERDILTTFSAARKSQSALNELVKKRDSIDRSIQGLIRTEAEAARAEQQKEVVVVGYGSKQKPNLTIKAKAGQAEPLWVVDGKEMPFSPLNEIDANSIESITVLKDASAAALYGAKAVNGVVIITTKKAAKATKKN